MESSFDLPDSTDWLDTPLSLFTPLESSLRCQVCKDFFDNPVITSCCHTFCSLCIRRCLSTEGKCPACRSSDQELKLRRNWAVQELVEAFNNARPKALELARKERDAEKDGGEQQPLSKKRKVQPEPEDDEYIPENEGRQTRSRSRRGGNEPPSDTVEAIEDSGDENQAQDDGLVSCPICNRRMKNEAVFQHLDTCTGNASPPQKSSFGSLQPPQSTSRTLPKPFMQLRNASSKPPERLPMINYSLLKDGVLRKKLKDLGIPNFGNRPLLQRRHTEWMNLWNANCDSKEPKSKRELLHELDVWERTQGGMAASSSDTNSGVMRKDFDVGSWSSNHNDEFKRLIANARKKSDAMIRSTIPQAAQTPGSPERAPIAPQPIASQPIAPQPVAPQFIAPQPAFSPQPAFPSRPAFPPHLIPHQPIAPPPIAPYPIAHQPIAPQPAQEPIAAGNVQIPEHLPQPPLNFPGSQEPDNNHQGNQQPINSQELNVPVE